jgi:ring-1,2-phenylacetyl-CoA epoxidase subunit PaaD
MSKIDTEQVYQWLASVSDPEVPVLSVLDLGVVRKVAAAEDEHLQPVVSITITPTYSGCPAMDMIAMNIRLALLSHGVKNINIESQLSPAWTTDWMTENGKAKLKEYGIAPPQRKASDPLALFEEDGVPCPRCGSEDTEMVSQFGATSCKALYKCHHCHEPFEHFKCH